MKRGLIDRDHALSEISLKEIEVAGKVCGDLAQIDIKQVYQNNGPQSVETIYIFPIPDLALVTDFSARIGNSTVDGFIMDKEEAKGVYEKETGLRGNPFLTGQQPPNVLQISVGGLLPGETAYIHISYVQEFKFHDHQLRIAIPPLVSPGYDHMPAAQDSGGQQRANYRATLRMSVDLLGPALNYHSPSHTIRVERLTEDKAIIGLAEEYARMDRDFVLICTCSEVQSSRGVVYRNKNNQQTVYLNFVPELPSIEENRAKNYIFLLDISGSMTGHKLAQVKSALNICLRNLSETDTFSMAAFENQLHLFSHGQRLPFTQVSLDRASEWIYGLKPVGQGEMLEAIRYALPTDSNTESIILLFTDGQTAHQDTMIDHIQHNIGKNRIFAFGTDPDADSDILEKIAQWGRGKFICVYPGERIDDKAVREFARITSPVSQSVQLDWTEITTEDVFPERLYKVFDMEPITILARFSGPLEGEIVLRGRTGPNDFCLTLDASDIKHDSQLGFLEKIWASKRIQCLEDALSYTYPGKYEMIRNEIIKLSKNQNILSSLTSFVAVNVRPNRISGLPVTRMAALWPPIDPGDDMAYSADHDGACNNSCAPWDTAQSINVSEAAQVEVACMLHQIPSGDRLTPMTHQGLLRILARNQQANGAFSSSVQSDLLTKVDTTALTLMAFTVGNENIRVYRKQLEKSVKYLIERTISGRITPEQTSNSEVLLKTALALKLCLAKNILKKTTEECIYQWIDHIRTSSQASSSLVGCQDGILKFIDHDTQWQDTQTIRRIAVVNGNPSGLEEQIILSGNEKDIIPALARLGILRAING